MVKSTIKLADGTVVTVEGSPEELKKVLAIYHDRDSGIQTEKHTEKGTAKSKKSRKIAKAELSDGNKKDYIVALINAIKNSNDVDEIESKILDKASQVDKVLLPLFIVSREFDNKFSLTSGDIYKVLKELGISMALPNVSRTLKKRAVKYVIADKVTKKGESTPYKISRKGEQYISGILGK